MFVCMCVCVYTSNGALNEYSREHKDEEALPLCRNRSKSKQMARKGKKRKENEWKIKNDMYGNHIAITEAMQFVMKDHRARTGAKNRFCLRKMCRTEDEPGIWKKSTNRNVTSSETKHANNMEM